MAFCSKCGTQMVDDARFCSVCGQPVQPPVYQTQTSQPFTYQTQVQHTQSSQAEYKPYVSSNGSDHNAMLYTLSKKLMIETIIWFVVSIIEIIAGFICINSGIKINSSYFYNNSGGIYIFLGVFAIFVAIYNFYFVNKNYKYSNGLLKYPVHIVEEFQSKSIGNYVLSIIGNLVAFGLFGLAAAIYSLTIRNFVLNNARIFKTIEKEFIEAEEKRHKSF